MSTLEIGGEPVKDSNVGVSIEVILTRLWFIENMLYFHWTPDRVHFFVCTSGYVLGWSNIYI